MAKTVISIEIGTARIRMAELVLGKKRQTVKKADIFDTPDGAIDDGFIHDSTALAEQMNLRIKNMKAASKEVVFSISSNKVISREVIVSAEKEKMLKSIVDAEVSDYFPMDLTGYIITHTIIGRDPEKKQFRLMVYAAPEALLQQYYDLAADMHREVASIDFASNSLYQWLKRSTLEDVSMVIEINSASSILTVLNNGDMGVQRTIGYGTGILATALMETRAYDEAVSPQEALRLMQEQTFFSTSETEDVLWRQNEIARIRARRFERIENSRRSGSEDEAAATREGFVPSERSVERLLSDEEVLSRRINARSEVSDAARQLTANIRRVIDYYATKNPEFPITRIYITGLGSTIKGLETMISSELSIPAEIYNVTEGITFVKSAEELSDQGPEFLACFGAIISPLGLRSEEAIMKSKKQNVAVLAAVIFVAAFAGLGYLVISTKMEISKEEKRTVQLQEDIKTVEGIEQLKAVYEASQKSIGEMAEADQMIYTIPEQFNDILKALEDELPSRSIISSLSLNGSSITMNMATVTKEEAAKVLVQLRKIPYIIGVETTGIVEELDEVTKRSQVTFTVECLLQRVIAEPKTETQEGLEE